MKFILTPLLAIIIALSTTACAAPSKPIIQTDMVVQSKKSPQDTHLSVETPIEATKHETKDDITNQFYDVVRVVDGDTLVINYKGQEEKLRLIGVDTPESVHTDTSKNTAEGQIASDYTKAALEDQKIEIEFDVQERDKYGRLLAYIYLDDKMFNKTLLEEGIARLATFPPNVKYIDDFTALQEAARDNQKGFWKENSIAQEKPVDNTKVETIKLIGSLKSDKYHRESCTHAKKITNDNAIHFDTVKDAEAAGYKPCGVCKPK